MRMFIDKITIILSAQACIRESSYCIRVYRISFVNIFITISNEILIFILLNIVFFVIRRHIFIHNVYLFSIEEKIKPNFIDIVYFTQKCCIYVFLASSIISINGNNIIMSRSNLCSKNVWPLYGT